jgi:CheY-like chemotaxis protein/DNA-directed RNA polymerase specialized sigma24 family protein
VTERVPRPFEAIAIEAVIIDDEIRQDSAMVGLLALEEVKATCVPSGASGLQLALPGVFDVILLDLKLPDVLGITVLNELRRRRTPIPVVVVTGHYLLSDHAERAIELGAAAFLRKPLFDIEDFAAMLRRIVAEYVPPTPDSVGQPTAIWRPPCRGRSFSSSSDRRGRRMFPELPALHQRALSGVADAYDAIASLLLPELRRRLWNKAADARRDDRVDQCVVDALMEYTGRPRRYDSSRGLTLAGFLEYAAWRNLRNYRTSERRRSHHETTDVPSGFWDAQAAAGAREAESPNLAWLRRMLPLVTADLTPEERTVFELHLCRSHPTD